MLAAKLMAIAWHEAVVANSPFAYQAFYKQYPVSPYSQIALKLQQQPKILPLYQPTNNFAPGQFGQQYKFTTLHQINPVQMGGSQQGNLPINKLPVLNPMPGNGQGNGNNQGNGIGVGNGLNKLAPGIDLAHGSNGSKIEPVITGNHNITTLPTNKIDPVVTGNHVPTLPNGNPGNIDPKLHTNVIVQQPTGGSNTGVVNNKLITNGHDRLLNSGPANNNPAQFHPVINNFHPTTITGNNSPMQSRAQMIQPPVRNFGGGGGGGGGNIMMHAFH